MIGGHGVFLKKKPVFYTVLFILVLVYLSRAAICKAGYNWTFREVSDRRKLVVWKLGGLVIGIRTLCELTPVAL